jgi:hypothetical protein
VADAVVADAHLVAALEVAADVSGVSLGVVRVDLQQTHPLGARVHLRVRLDAGDRHRASRRVHAVVDDVPVEDAVVRAGDGEREALLALAQRSLGLAPLGDVDGRPGHPLGAPAAVAKALGAVHHPANLAVADDAVLDVEPRRAPARWSRTACSTRA